LAARPATFARRTVPLPLAFASHVRRRRAIAVNLVERLVTFFLGQRHIHAIAVDIVGRVVRMERVVPRFAR
jgi:hypothetical protein